MTAKKYEMRVYAGVKMVDSKEIEIDPEDYDDDYNQIERDLDILAEEFKDEVVCAEWCPVD